MKHLYSLLAAAVLSVTCTAQKPATRLIPEAPEGHRAMGREYIALTSDSIDVELGYDGLHGDHMVFDFVVINRTVSPLTIVPSDFYYVLLDSATADSSRLPPRMALHPERVLHRYDDILEDRQADREINSLLGFIDAGIGILAKTTAFIASEDPGYIADAVFETLGTAGYYVSRDNRIGTDVELIRQEKEVVDEEIFRQAELPPGKVVSGYVYFPRDRDARCLMFCFPVEDQLFQFVYSRQRVFEPE